MGCMRKEAVAKDASNPNLISMEALSYSPLCVIGEMFGVVAPPSPVIVPKMMI